MAKPKIDLQDQKLQKRKMINVVPDHMNSVDINLLIHQ
jgi:hypothetical protein